MTMNKSVWTVNLLNLKNIKAPYIITGVTFLCMIIQDMIKVILSMNGSDLIEVIISSGDILWLLMPLAGIFIAAKNFRRLINLGGRRWNFFLGSLVTYLILSATVSLVSTLMYYTYERFMANTGYFLGVINLADVFGWSARGPVMIFLEQFAFLFLFAVFTHTLTAMQDKWYGWAADIAIAAIISVFTPIASLRASLVWFFNLILFHSSAFIQIAACIALGAVISAASLPVINRKSI
jgi:hypothetical protein